MKRDPLERWLAQATCGIKFGPDRRTVSSELREHIEDKLCDIRRIYPDMTQAAVLERALSQMGDAEEIGRELAKIHRPWLGYLWRATQVLLVCMLVAATLLIEDWPDWSGSYSVEPFLFPERLPMDTEWGEVRAIGAGAEIIEVGGYTFEVSRASVFVRSEGNSILLFTLRVHTHRPWELPDRDVCHWISVSDSAGNYWNGYRERAEYDDRAPTSVSCARSGLTWREYEGRVSLFHGATGVEMERAWEYDFTLLFDNGDTFFSIPIQWKEVLL